MKKKIIACKLLSYDMKRGGQSVTIIFFSSVLFSKCITQISLIIRPPAVCGYSCHVPNYSYQLNYKD